MYMMGIHMVEVEGMDMPEERPSTEWLKDEGMDMVSMDIVEEMTAEVVKREHEDVVLTRQWISDGVKRHQ
jgi:hypothetical protein